MSFAMSIPRDNDHLSLYASLQQTQLVNQNLARPKMCGFMTNQCSTCERWTGLPVLHQCIDYRLDILSDRQPRIECLKNHCNYICWNGYCETCLQHQARARKVERERLAEEAAQNLCLDGFDRGTATTATTADEVCPSLLFAHHSGLKEFTSNVSPSGVQDGINDDTDSAIAEDSRDCGKGKGKAKAKTKTKE